MKFHFFAAVAAIAVGLSNSALGVAAISKDEAVQMRQEIADELRLFKLKDRKYRLNDKDGPEKATSDDGRKRNRKVEKARFADTPGARAARSKRKLLMVKLNILNLAEIASEEDLDKMLAIYDQMEAHQIEAGEDGKHGSKKPEMKKLRSELDEIAAPYGGLKRAAAPMGRRPRPERSFSKEDAAKVKELRAQLKATDDEEEQNRLRKELQDLYGPLKFRDTEERRRKKKDARNRVDVRHHALV